MKKIISTDAAPKAIGPYSQAVKAGPFLYISGQIPLDPQTMTIKGTTIEEQTRQVFANIKAILSAAEMDFEHVVKVTVLLSDISDFKTVNEIYTQYFTQDFPARAAYQVAALPMGAKIEIETISYLESS
ncbi:MAG: hypothetical protein DKM50_00590 [Candidatus Margulisiibacteriota bacterium]|nr:MAG: hypothetical protein A2X43_05510 [Candidatus Margulisbacteria bacterium GWD2_39_127]OGI04370.1 MAG: hypothetical protein A2X42_07190 [Candidatus Margulisbacteria bacterium GWF2_38_17]OGI07774.1 MAG: hypothetical protein A2X41_07780 [Candidatus Margulisbacteria bacterium GWE2_39_32]PZM84823.1 MAG: hypothetical protein DKM50_00590 [Candidatus Margulisiibacteriota bacterium]HAR63304.1 reactive intermediate/imine deaminase [Candidatus Margulisiibacteriota bacterium]